VCVCGYKCLCECVRCVWMCFVWLVLCGVCCVACVCVWEWWVWLGVCEFVCGVWCVSVNV